LPIKFHNTQTLYLELFIYWLKFWCWVLNESYGTKISHDNHGICYPMTINEIHTHRKPWWRTSILTSSTFPPCLLKMCFCTNSGPLNFLPLIGHSHLSLASSCVLAVTNFSTSVRYVKAYNAIIFVIHFVKWKINDSVEKYINSIPCI
jgi:hypothetical protein